MTAESREGDLKTLLKLAEGGLLPGSKITTPDGWSLEWRPRARHEIRIVGDSASAVAALRQAATAGIARHQPGPDLGERLRAAVSAGEVRTASGGLVAAQHRIAVLELELADKRSEFAQALIERNDAREERDSLRETASRLHRQISEQDRRLASVREVVDAIKRELVRYDDEDGVRRAWLRIEQALEAPEAP